MSGNSLTQTVHTHRASVHQAAKLVATLLRVAGVTAGLTECNRQPTAGFMTHTTYRLTAKNRNTIRYDTRCYFNVRSKADISQLNLPHGTDN